jgi:hypothetical protein
MMVNVPVDAPALMVTFAGTVTDEFDEVRFTVQPPVGAGALRVMVPEELLPPTTVLGERLKLAMVSPTLTVRVVFTEAPPRVAVIAAEYWRV